MTVYVTLFRERDGWEFVKARVSGIRLAREAAEMIAYELENYLGGPPVKEETVSDIARRVLRRPPYGDWGDREITFDFDSL